MLGNAFCRDRSNLNIERITQSSRKLNGPALLPETDEKILRMLASHVVFEWK